MAEERERRQHLVRFYELLGNLDHTLGGTRTLSECNGRRGWRWPQRGVYFFQEPGEDRSDTGAGPRIVRVGTHGLTLGRGRGPGTTLWTRLSRHKGVAETGGGYHRGSIFRLIVGTALIEREGHVCPTWGNGSTAPREITEAEQPMERKVSTVIGRMPFLWLAINDARGPQSLRGYIERNAIALLSNHGKEPLDPPSTGWLGGRCNRERVRSSGLWNQEHVDKPYDPAFLDTLDRLIQEMGRAA